MRLARLLLAGVLLLGPALLRRLGIRDEITISETEYDNLFIVIRPEIGEPSLLRLRY